MTFYEIEFPLAALSPEAVEAALLEIGASSITFVDRGDEPVLEPKPGEVRLWSDTLVRALFEASCGSGSGSSESASTDAARNLGRLAAALGPHITETARVRRVENQEWERVWLTDWKSMRFGRRLWVCPHEAEPPQDADAVVVRLDPGREDSRNDEQRHQHQADARRRVQLPHYFHAVPNAAGSGSRTFCRDLHRSRRRRWRSRTNFASLLAKHVSYANRIRGSSQA